MADDSGHEGLQLQCDPPGSNRVEGIGRYRFQVPPDLWEQLQMREVIRDTKGEPMFEVRQGQATNGDRVLLVRKP